MPTPARWTSPSIAPTMMWSSACTTTARASTEECWTAFAQAKQAVLVLPACASAWQNWAELWKWNHIRAAHKFAPPCPPANATRSKLPLKILRSLRNDCGVSENMAREPGAAASCGNDPAVSGVKNEIFSGSFRGDFHNLVPGFFEAFHCLDPDGMTIRQLHENVEFAGHAVLPPRSTGLRAGSWGKVKTRL